MTSTKRIRPAVAAALVAATALWPASPGRAAPEEPRHAGSGIREVGRVPLFWAPEFLQESLAGGSGWLVLNPASRRGYQVFEIRRSEPGRGIVSSTVVQSFDLDTLQPRRRAMLAGIPITGGPADGGTVNGTTFAGEVVHAVDPVAGRIYLALSQSEADDRGREILLNVGNPPDGQRPLSRLVAIDEARFDAGRDDFAASFREPETQAKLHHYWLLGLAVTRHHVGAGDPGRLLALFAQPMPAGAANVAPFFDHTLAQWDPSNLQFTKEAALATDPTPTGSLSTPAEATTTRVREAGLPRQLEACRGGSVATNGAYGKGNYQWGLLATAEAVWTACQAANSAGAVVRVGLDGTGHLQQVGGQELFRVSQSISDVLVDPGGGRLLVRSFGNGQTWWVFDTGLRRFTGAVSAKASDNYALAAGIDPTTGRLYQQLPDYESGGTPFRGGFMVSDTRLDPAPAPENVRADLVYPAVFRIQVDTATRRVFLRRGHGGFSGGPVFPGTQNERTFPEEFFYRVLEDRIPVTGRPPAADDSAFTTDVPESPLTRASFLGSGSGYGSRAWLVGGLDAATNRTGVVGHEKSPCGRDDRELVAGAVRAVEVSDVSTAADAASLDADGTTRDHLGTPLHRCSPPDPWDNMPEELDTSEAETKEAAFGPEGDNLYRATCTGDEAGSATAPADKVVPRDRFSAKAVCRHSDGRAEATSTGALSLPALDAAQDGLRQAAPAQAKGQVPADHLTVGHSSSTVTVSRTAGRGTTVRADAVVREVSIPGVGTIGAVRAEAVVTANGRRGGARGTFERTVCDIELAGFVAPGCYRGSEQLETAMNQALGSRGKVRFRDPDPVLREGSPSGYKAGIQRAAADAFEDTRIARDTSPALPAMELVLYNGDSASGTGRQFLHLAGVYANASYGIACLHGQRDDGRCAKADEQFDSAVDDDDSTGGADGEAAFTTLTEPGQTIVVPGPGGGRSLLERILRAPVRIVADVLRLVFSSPGNAALVAAVWALGYGPCRLAARRRRIESVRALRAAWEGAA